MWIITHPETGVTLAHAGTLAALPLRDYFPHSLLPGNPPIDFTLSDGVNELVWRDDPPAAPEPETAEQVKARLTHAVQMHLDARARAAGYDGILSAVSYEHDANPVFAAEAAGFKAWRSDVWSTCYGVTQAVMDGVRAIPDEAELIAALPTCPV